MVKVFKFGGASVGDAAAIRNMASIIHKHAGSSKLLVVVSAMGKTTNALENIYDLSRQKDATAETRQALHLLKEYHLNIVNELFRTGADIYNILENLFSKLEATLEAQALNVVYDEGYDQVISFGEIIATHIVAQYLQSTGTDCNWLDARKYIMTNTLWRDAAIDWTWTEKKVQTALLPRLEEKVLITQGFIGGTVDGRTTTLGREGSDYTAAILASCLQASLVTIWKDVPGILNADPKRIEATELYEYLSYKEAAEMTYYGATVIHPKTIRPLANKNIPLYVRSFIEPDKPGTCISEKQPDEIQPAIIFKPNQRLISFGMKNFNFISEQNLSTILHALSELNIRINMMQNSAISFSICIDNNPRKIDILTETLSKEYIIQYNDNLQIITIKNFTPRVIESLMENKEILLEQKTRSTYQAVVKE